MLYAETRPGENVLIKISDFGISVRCLASFLILFAPNPPSFPSFVVLFFSNPQKMLKADQKAAQTFIGRDYDYAPELVTKGHTTTRSDIYQCGLVLFRTFLVLFKICYHYLR